MKVMRECKTSCDSTEGEVDIFCGNGEICCKPNQPCLGLGGTFIDFDIEGKCCLGLKASPDCDVGENGCICKKCPCYICLECGDGECGVFEHICNCPEDCLTKDKAISFSKSDCAGDPYGADKSGKLILTAGKNSLAITHAEFPMNCCLELEISYIPLVDEIYVMENIKEPYTPCFCECLFTIEGMIEGLKSGNYTFTLYNEEQNKVLFQQPVTIP
jgi:hypothetical protein